MLFSSLTFLFIFLPLTIIIYFLAKDRFKNSILLIASLIFYSWGEPKHIILMLLSIIMNYFLARLIHRYRRNSRRKKCLLVLAIVLNLGTLFAFKYLDFAITNLNQLFHFNLPLSEIALPIGISFYTFQILSYVIDVYRGKVKVQTNIFTLGAYISLFPQLIAGPIVRYASVERQLTRRTHSLAKFCAGFRRFIIGLAKKLLIANNVAVIADTIFNNPSAADYGLLPMLLALLAHALQIYYDFSGYSDMAIGLGKIFGFDFDENFNYPYSALSITDFWRRWHISLTTWFRDYLYIPLGGNRCSKPKWLRNFFAVWLFTGLWHGASWNYLIWGIFYALTLLFEKLYLHRFLDRLPRLLRWLYTFIIVNFAWLLFRVEDLGVLKSFIATFRHPRFANLPNFLSDQFYLLYYLPFIFLGFIFMFPVYRALSRFFLKTPFRTLLFDLLLVALLLFCIISLINNSYNPFIYFRF